MPLAEFVGDPLVSDADADGSGAQKGEGGTGRPVA
jgi:hypothetical protein